jgi:hypothetical protein
VSEGGRGEGKILGILVWGKRLEINEKWDAVMMGKREKILT